MTEAEWRACADPTPMLQFLRGKVSERKLRLFACAWGYLLWGRMTDERSKQAVVTAERFADGLAARSELIAAFNAAQEAWKSIRVAFRGKDSQSEKAARASGASKGAAEVARNAATPEWNYGAVRISSWRDTDKTVFLLSTFAKDIFGSLPFRSPSLDLAWLAWNDGAIRKLAQAIYDERAFGRLPLLADALEEAGCTDTAILAHCREPREHVRGCWVVDLLLGKS